MGTRTVTAALAAALAVLAAGCGNKCNEQTPPVSQVPPGCTANASATIQVPIHVCPKCDQGMPSCVVHPETGGQILVEPVSEVCDPNSSCALPDLNTCPFATMNCAVQAPSTPTNYTIVVNTPGAPENIPLTVVASGAPATACPFP